MDALSDVLRTVCLKGAVFLHAEFTAPWCLHSEMEESDWRAILGDANHMIPYHYVVEGRLQARVDGGEPVEIGAGEVVLFPHNDSHLIGSTLAMPSIPAGSLVNVPAEGGLFSIRHGGGGEVTRIVCGFLGCDRLDGNPLASSLPRVLSLNRQEGTAGAWMRSSFQFAADEIAARRAGSATVLAKLSELLFVEAVRQYVDLLPQERTGWLMGLRDPFVARTLSLIHARVAEPWTVDDLGREVGLSRSALADRFTRLIGEPPMRYLARWRLQLAAHRLRVSGESLARIAEEIGYESEAAFNRAFKRQFGAPPATWRRGSS
jgi:AraC-like DNA-binding protein